MRIVSCICQLEPKWADLRRLTVGMPTSCGLAIVWVTSGWKHARVGCSTWGQLQPGVVVHIDTHLALQ
jgi:hypothetical protein